MRRHLLRALFSGAQPAIAGTLVLTLAMVLIVADLFRLFPLDRGVAAGLGILVCLALYRMLA